MNNTKLIIFDLGNVVISISFEGMYSFWAGKLGMDMAEIKRRFHFDLQYERFERGEISGGDYYRHVNSCLDGRLSYADFLKGWNSIYLGTVPGIEDLLSSLKDKYLIAALTNTNALHHPVWRDLFKDVLSCFDRIYCSYELKMRKPDKGIFEFILKEYGAGPGEALFIDDNKDNVEQAVSMGISSILAEPSAGFISSLKARLAS